MQPTQPIIVAEGADLTFHATLLEAQNAIEPDDVRMSTIKVWDADGQAFDVVLETDDKVRGAIMKFLAPPKEWIRLVISDRPADPQGLTVALRNYLMQTQPSLVTQSNASDLQLAELLQIVQSGKR